MDRKEERQQGVMHFDYKDVDTLHKYINPHGRMFSRKRTHFTASEQRAFANAIKRARFMALMPYVSR